MMKHKFFSALLAIGTAFCCGAADLPEQLDPRLPRSIVIGETPQLTLVKNGEINFEIVVPADAAPTARFAGNEMATLLGEALQTKLQVRKEPSGKVPAFILGSPAIAKENGIDVAALDRDGFVIRTIPQGILIFGRDDPQKSEHETVADHATLFGTYDFLERFAGMRFYLPGKYGTIVPRLTEWTLPSITIYERPDFYYRKYSDYSGKFGSEWTKEVRILNRLRNRYGTRTIYYCHGLRALGYGRRFGKSHPEYFALQSNGKRVIDTEYTGTSNSDNSHLCFSSDIKKEIIADAVSYFKGEDASVRGVLKNGGEIGWSYIFPKGGKFFSISPNDGVVKCHCPKCEPILLKGTPQQQSDHMYAFFRDVAQGVKDSGVDGFLTIPYHYGYWCETPPFPLPDNIVVDFSMRGPWSELTPRDRDSALFQLKKCFESIHSKVLLWTYPGKYEGMGQGFPGIPALTPRYSASYMKRVAPYARGCYFESSTDYLFFDYLAFYVYGKILWNPDIDIEKLLDEHHTLMYGPAAKPIKEFFDTIEQKWMKIAGNAVHTAMGPVTIYPSTLEIWNSIYSASEVQRLNALFTEAEKLAANSQEHLYRVKTLRREMFQPILDEREKYNAEEHAIAAWGALMQTTDTAPAIDGNLEEAAWKQAERLTLIPSVNKPLQVRSTVMTLCDKENFYFAFQCEAPNISSVVKRPFDSHDTWSDPGVEIFLSPDQDKTRCYQIMINASGSVADLMQNKGTHDWSWNSNAEVQSVITPGKGWTTEVRIPRNTLPQANETGMLANFTRRYTPEKGRAFSYVWGPFLTHSNGDVHLFGALRFKPETTTNLIKNGDFEQAQTPKKVPTVEGWGWNGSNRAFPAVTDYLVKGQAAALLDSDNAASYDSCSIYQKVPLKPDTDYVLRFLVRMDKVTPSGTNSSGFYLRMDDFSRREQCFPGRSSAAMSGTCPWTPIEFHFKTSQTILPKRTPRICFILRKATGKVWIDHVELFEVGN